MNIPTKPSIFIPIQGRNPKARIRFGLILAALGLLIFILGAEPSWFGLDRSPVTGFVQIAVFLFGLAMICIGGYIALVTLWYGRELPITADIGSRLISTGYVVAVASGMADVFGFGSEALPKIPDFGIWQQRGVMFGEVLIAIGLFLMIPLSQGSPDDEEILPVLEAKDPSLPEVAETDHPPGETEGNF